MRKKIASLLVWLSLVMGIPAMLGVAVIAVLAVPVVLMGAVAAPYIDADDEELEDD
jgi:uncharacterized protein involved in cysteine biosynthesis